MTREQAIRKRDHLAASVSQIDQVLRGSLFQRSLRHSSGCPKCARGEGHPLWVLNVGYPGGKTRQISLRPEQVPQVRRSLQNYHRLKETIEAISELNQQLLVLDRNESRDAERQS
jgi:hypothetical protein